MNIEDIDIENDDVNVVKEAIGQGADIDVKDENGRTALMKASFMNSLEVAKLLIEQGVDVNEKRDDGSTPLTWASSAEMMDLLKKHGGKEIGDF